MVYGVRGGSVLLSGFRTGHAIQTAATEVDPGFFRLIYQEAQRDEGVPRKIVGGIDDRLDPGGFFIRNSPR